MEKMKIQITTYQQIENQNYGNAEILISKDIFEGVDFQKEKIVFSFSNCRFKKLTIKNTENIDFKDVLMSFSFCQIQQLEIVEIQSNNIGFYYHGCILEGSINNINIKSVTLNNCITLSLFLQFLENIEVSYTDENIFVKNWIELLKPTNMKNIDELLTIKQDLSIRNSKLIRLRFNHTQEEKMGIYRDKYNQNPNWKIRYHLSKQQKNKLNINLSVYFSNQEDKLLKLEDCILNSVSLSGAAKGKISIENTAINNLFIRDFSSESATLLYNIYPFSEESKLEVHKSNMDNTWFDNIDFNGYRTLSFYRTRFAKASFTSCNFPEDNLSFEKFKTLENIHYPDKKPQNYYKDQYETFLQLKKSLEGSGNYYEAQKLGAISKESLRKISKLPNGDKFILWTSAKSNNHGLSIKKPLLGLLGFSILFYILYLLSIGRIFNSNGFDWILVGHYFSFMDLTHRKDFLVSSEDFTFWTLILDFVNKLVVGFFLYQFVAAFRKYGKN